MRVCNGTTNNRKAHAEIVHQQPFPHCPLCDALERAAKAEDFLEELAEQPLTGMTVFAQAELQGDIEKFLEKARA